ncbi:hypothetical protein PENTCL1PPCAC_21768, partial [Pristionchus entomophagus]
SAILSSWIVRSGIPWQTGLFLAPLFTIAPLIGLFFAQKSFRSVEQQRNFDGIISSAFRLFSNKSLLILITASSLKQFHSKAFTFWSPSMFLNAWNSSPDSFFGLSYTTLTTLISSSSMIGIVMGLGPIMWFAQSWRHGTDLFSGRTGFMRAYPIVVSFGAMLNVASYIIGLLILIKSYVAFLQLMMMVSTSSGDIRNCNTCIQMVVPTSSRPAAIALSRLIIGIVTIPSAQLVGMISDAIRGDSTLSNDRLHAYPVV